jgi:hypothetical protein
MEKVIIFPFNILFRIKEEALDLGVEALSDGRPTTKFNN